MFRSIIIMVVIFSAMTINAQTTLINADSTVNDTLSILQDNMTMTQSVVDSLEKKVNHTAFRTAGTRQVAYRNLWEARQSLAQSKIEYYTFCRAVFKADDIETKMYFNTALRSSMNAKNLASNMVSRYTPSQKFEIDSQGRLELKM